MTHSYAVPDLHLFNSDRKRLKTQRSTVRQDEIKFYSPNHQANRFYFPESPKEFHKKVESKEKRNHSKCHQPIHKANKRQCKKSCLSTYPSCYLDYPPQNGYITNYTNQYEFQGFLNNERWSRPEHDHTSKLDMYTQTSHLRENNMKTEGASNKFGDVVSSNHHQILFRNDFNGSFKYDQGNPEQLQLVPRNPIKPVKNEVEFENKKASQIADILEEDSSHCSSKFKGEKLVIPKSESSIRGQDYKKTFSEAILDQLFEKDLQEEYEQKYNKDKKYSEVIVCKLQKTVQSKAEKIQMSRQTFKKEQNMHSNNTERYSIPMSNELRSLEKEPGERMSLEQINKSRNSSPTGHRPLQNQNTINMLVNGEIGNYKNSPVQTVDQTNQNSRNQVIQTDNSQSALIIQRLVQNVIDDKEFRRRINEKKDQFDRIKIEYQPNLYIELQELIDSKDSYLHYSQEFLAKLNRLIENTTSTQRRKISSIHHQQLITRRQPPPVPQLLPPKQSVISNVQIPIKFPPVHGLPSPQSPPQISFPSFPFHPGSLPMTQYHVHPPPNQITLQVPYRRVETTARLKD